MSEKLIQDGDVIVRELGALRRITLNRPQALNAITLDMAVTMTAFMRAWADDPAVGAVLHRRRRWSRASLPAATCARCTMRRSPAVHCPRNSGRPNTSSTSLIARYPKPVIAVMDGLVMGGGMGISAHAAHRVVTERSALAMPEVGIGFFPDIGASFLLARAPGEAGSYLALTGGRIGAADAIYCGLADVHIAAARLAELAAALADCRSTDDVWAALGKLGTPPTPGRVAAARGWIDRCYAADDVETIVDRLQSCDAEPARAGLQAMEKASPTSLKVTLRNLRTAATFKRVEQSFQQDYRIALACIAGHDFIEGIRATIVDKDRNPAWRPDKIEAVTPDIVDRHFRSVGALELKFEN